MLRQPKFRVFNTADGWCVNVPASLSESGKRERHFHKTRDKAQEHAAQLRDKFEKHGKAAMIIKPGLAEAATLAEKILKPYGVSLVEAAKMVARMKKKERASKPLGEAADAWLQACEGLRDRTVEGYRQTAKRLQDALGKRLLSNITADDLQKVIAPPGSGGATVLGRIRNARAFWRWAAKKGWCNADLFSSVEKPKVGRDRGEIGILTPAEVRKLIEAAVAAGVPLESLLFEFGHTTNPAVLRERYVGLASKKDAIAFFSIGPKGEEVPAIAVA